MIVIKMCTYQLSFLVSELPLCVRHLAFLGGLGFWIVFILVFETKT